MNKVILIGRLGRDPELRYTANGTPVCSFSMATDEKWKDRDGQDQKRTEWHRIVAWQKLAEICGEYLHKGSLVYVEGQIRQREYEGNDGEKRRAFEINIQQMRMLDKRGASGDDVREGFGANDPGPAQPATEPGQDDDSIPF